MRRHMRRIVRRRRQRCLGLESIVDDGEERGEGGREEKCSRNYLVHLYSIRLEAKMDV